MPQITNIEIKTASSGKPYKVASMDGEVLGKNRFNIFSFHTRYADVVTGRSFAPEEFEQDGQYIKLRDPDAGIKKPFRRGADPVAVAIAQQQKADNIEKAQDNKDRAIRLSGSMNHAVSIVTKFNESLTPDEIKHKVLNWRDWFLENWDTKEALDPNEIPF